MSPAILFDLDGTLIDTPAGITRVYHEVLAEDGRTAPETVIRATIGRPLDAAFGVLLGLPADSAEVARGVTRFRELFRDEVVPNARELIFPGIPAMLARLRGGGHPLAIVTSKVETSAREILGAAGMVDECVTAWRGAASRTRTSRSWRPSDSAGHRRAVWSSATRSTTSAWPSPPGCG